LLVDEQYNAQGGFVKRFFASTQLILWGILVVAFTYEASTLLQEKIDYYPLKVSP